LRLPVTGDYNKQQPQFNGKSSSGLLYVFARTLDSIRRSYVVLLAMFLLLLFSFQKANHFLSKTIRTW
jgi:hypothetical protein